MALQDFWTPSTRRILATLSTEDPSEIQKSLLDFYLTNPSQEDQAITLTPIVQRCIRDNNIPLILNLLRDGFHVSTSIARQAVEYRARDIIQVFLDNGWDINDPVSETEPPVLGSAVDDLTMLCWLLDRGADPNKRCTIDLTPFSMAVVTAPLVNIKLLLKRGADIGKGKPVHYAIDREMDVIPVLQLLLQHGAAIDAPLYDRKQDYASWRLYSFRNLGTPLHLAACAGRTNVIEFLLNKGADATLEDNHGRTPRQCAEFYQHQDAARLLTRGELNSKRT